MHQVVQHDLARELRGACLPLAEEDAHLLMAAGPALDVELERDLESDRINLPSTTLQGCFCYSKESTHRVAQGSKGSSKKPRALRNDNPVPWPRGINGKAVPVASPEHEVSFVESLEELGNPLWRVLKISVHTYQFLPLGFLEASKDRTREPSLGLADKDSDREALLLKLVHRLLATILRVVIDDENFCALVHPMRAKGIQ
mmetsp:Transcript_52045/g.161834  ORF Transcript_52045/g.161834 Transcript_52045/m.161834 type:complete len:201 (-) Transcript_52045:228-830(-)